jgi:two-component system sensor histidine kinase KdpD
VKAEESKRWGAKLKIFLSYAPGVGKSYRLLDEARRHERGEEVVVGAVQGQQSEDVQALLRKLELIASLQTPAGQAVDLDAILRRAPQVCVIDPLAAQNPPGSRHAYRWQDVQELLRKYLRLSSLRVTNALQKFSSGTAPTTRGGVRFFGNPVLRLIRAAEGIDVRVFPH